MKIIDCEQRSPEWIAARLGIPTASDFDSIITTTGLPSKSAQKYMYKLAGEKVSGQLEDSFKSAAMERGIIMEEEARNMYQMITDNPVQQVGFCVTEGKTIAGCSPDGLVGKAGGLEIKCPTCAVHVGYLLGKELPTDYFQQVQGSLWVTQREWWDFMSYYPGLPPLIVRVYPDKKFHAGLGFELELFCEKLAKVIESIKA